jgi:hypothetical protein
MRTTLVLDDELLEKAQEFTGVKEKSALVREALKALIEREAARRLARLGGGAPHLSAPPSNLQLLPQAVVASDEEVLNFIDRHRLVGLGIGYVDVHLLAATRLTAGASLWTRDKSLRDVAKRLALAATVPD